MKFWTSLILMFFILFLGLKIGYNLNERISLYKNPSLEKEIEHNDIVMDKRAWVIEVVAREQLPWHDYFFFKQNSLVLLGYIYTLFGFAGGIASFWLRLSGLRKSRNSKVFSFEYFMLSGFGGVTMFFLLLLPAPFLSTLFTSDITLDGISGSSSPEEFLGRTAVLGILAGLFLSTFLEEVESFFKRIFNKS